MQAAHMTFAEEVVKLRARCKRLGLENAGLRKSNDSLHKRVLTVEQENRTLKQENRLLQQQQQQFVQKQQLQEQQLESLQLIVEELRGMVFRKQRKEKDETEEDEGTGQQKPKKKRKAAQRSPESYRRVTPPASDVTDTYEHSLTHCPDCGSVLMAMRTIIQYVEDLADVEKLRTILKRIEKHIIQSGYCPNCKRRKAAQAISPQVSILGENVKKFIAYLVIIMRLSFAQVRSFLMDTAGFAVSDGEIVVSLDEQAEKLTAENDRLFQKIRGAPGRHYDETGWRVQSGGQGNYCWISRPTSGEEAIFLMGRSRGKGNAKELRGPVDNQVGITDDYAGYDNLFSKHQLCMSHPQRKLRDLAEAKTLTGQSKAACQKTYQAFSAIYKDVEKTRATVYDKEVWLDKREEYMERLKALAASSEDDPQKLKRIKQSLVEHVKKYFTCLLEPDIPADNNKAERGLRHVVLKRKISYGSKSQKGADTMSILCSTILSCWWNKPANFFVAYNQLLTA